MPQRKPTKRRTTNLGPAQPQYVRRPQIKPHRRFLCKLTAHREVIIPAPVSVIAEHDASLRVRFLTETEAAGIMESGAKLDLSQQVAE